jgi:hypothetical protein
VLEQAGPLADHDSLDNLDAGREQQQPTEKQHRDDGGGHGAHDRENPEQHQADPEGQEPAPVVDDLCRNSDVQRLDLGHCVFSPLKGNVPLVLAHSDVLVMSSAQNRRGRRMRAALSIHPRVSALESHPSPFHKT